MRRLVEFSCAWLAPTALVMGGCAEPPPPAAPTAPEPVAEAPPEVPAEPEEGAASEPEADVDPEKVQPCGQDVASELPIVDDRMGEGERVVRLINNTQEDVQARLLDDDRKPVYQGTLRIEAGKIGEFRVPAGVYMVRYRRQTTCDVMRGAPLVLKGNHAGVEISIKPKFESGSKSKMKPVGEPL